MNLNVIFSSFSKKIITNKRKEMFAGFCGKPLDLQYYLSFETFNAMPYLYYTFMISQFMYQQTI